MFRSIFEENEGPCNDQPGFKFRKNKCMLIGSNRRLGNTRSISVSISDYQKN